MPQGKINLIPYLNMAIAKLRANLAKNSASEVRFTAILQLPMQDAETTQTEISDETVAPQLPTDLVEPLRMWEKPQCSGQQSFKKVTKVDVLPDVCPGSFLNFWQWQNGQINLVGATQPTTIKLEYESIFMNGLTPIVDPTDLIPLAFSSETLGVGCAWYAAMADAGATADTSALGELFQNGIDDIVVRVVKPGQYKSRRRKPYGCRRRIVYL